MRLLTHESYDSVGKDKNIVCIKYGKNTQDNTTKWKHLACGYEWNTSYGGISRGNGCPQCAGNAKLTQEDYDNVGKDRDILCIKYGNNTHDRTTKWKHLVCGYGWSTSYHNISQGDGCPWCAGNAKLTHESYDDIGKDRNIKCLKYGNNSVDNTAEWKHLICGFEWNTCYGNIQQGRGCPQCAGKLKKTHEDYDNAGKDRDIVCIKYGVNNSDKTAKWKHLLCEYEWTTCYSNIQQGTGCPLCAGNLKLTQEDYDNVGKERGIVCINYGNNSSDPAARWRHLICGRDWNTSYSSIGQGSGCSYCAGNLKLTLEDYNNVGKNKNIVCIKYGSSAVDNTARWRHLECKWEWNTTYNNMHRGGGCPKCSGRARLTHEDYDDIGKDRNIICIKYGNNSTDNTAKWKHIDCGNEWNTCYGNIYKGTGCPECVSLRREKLCRKIIERLTGCEFDKIRSEWLMGIKNARLELDGYSSILKVGFEHQGRQHYEYCPDFFHKMGLYQFEEQQERDKLKRRLCKERGINLIEIPYCIEESDLEEFIRQKLKENGIPVAGETNG